MYIDTEQNFFDRTDILNTLKRRVTDLKEGYRQNIALLGGQYVGKSTLLKHFILNLDDEDVICIYLDLEEKDFIYFYSKFVLSLLYNFAKTKKIPLHEDINILLETTKNIIPQTVEVIKKIQADIEQQKISEAYLGLLTLPEVFTNESQKFCVLVLDEFQHLEEFSIRDVFQSLGHKIMTQKRCLYIVSSSSGNAKRILLEKLSLLFGNFENIILEPFDQQIGQEFIERKLKEIKIGVQLRSFLADFTGGHPLFLQLICQELIHLSAVYKQSEVFMPILAQAVENIIFERWGALSRHFELVINELCHGKGNRVNALILISLSEGKNKINDLMEDLKIKKNLFMQRMAKLLEQGVVVKNGNFYYLKDKLLKFWVKFVYQKRLKEINLAPDRQRKRFREELNRYFENFKINARKDFPSRIMELFYCFENESLDLNGRKYKLPIFREMTPFKLKNEYGNDFDIIKASSDEEEWFIVLKKENLAEHDVHSIIAESKKMGYHLKRCLIISLTDLDENTRLKALQERFWIWNERELNTLMVLFDKPYIL